jgi:CubicO group peptidase (beta-lactamase class C family)
MWNCLLTDDSCIRNVWRRWELSCGFDIECSKSLRRNLKGYNSKAGRHSATVSTGHQMKLLLSGFGFGFGFALSPDGSCWWSDSGNTYFWIDPKEDLIVILMAQFVPNDYDPVFKEFKELVYHAIIY